MVNENIKIKGKKKEKENMLWVVLDTETHTLLKNLIKEIDNECGGRFTFNEMIGRLLKYVNVDNFVMSIEKRKDGELTPAAKAKIIKMLKGGK